MQANRLLHKKYKNESMNRFVQYIEENLSSELDAVLISKAGFISHAQLYRDFYSLTGHSVKEYIRKRRLSNALALVKASEFPLADIAYQCGYSSQQTFCRAVKQTLGMTPLEYKDSELYYFYPPYNGEPVQSVTVLSELIPRMVCFRFYHSNNKIIENIAVNTFLNVIPEYNGRIFGRNGKQDGSNFCYELYLTDTNRDYKVLERHGYVKSKTTMPFSTLFATSTVNNDEQKINTAWDYMYHNWLQSSMFEYTNEPYYEEYILRKGKPVKLKLYLPIKKRADEMKITLVSNPNLSFAVARAKGYNAEKIASKMVIDYLLEHYPYIVKTSKEFYLHKEVNSYVCGIKINSKLWLEDDKNIENITADTGSYLVLTSRVMGNYDQYADLLLSFALNNGMSADKKKIFAIYDAKESFKNPKIQMYCPINQNVIINWDKITL